MPPTGVWISTLLLLPSRSFTSTVQPSTVSQPANATAIRALALLSRTLGITMLRISFRGLCGAFNSSAALGDAWDRHRKTAVDGNLSKQRLHCTHLGNRHIGKSANIILNHRKTLRHVRVPHRQHHGLL